MPSDVLLAYPPRGSPRASKLLSIIWQPWPWIALLLVSYGYHRRVFRPQLEDLKRDRAELERRLGQDPTALDNFQHLHSHPVVHQRLADAPNAAESAQGHAVVTSLYTDSYAVPVATLGESLNKVNSTARRIVFYIPGHVSDRALCVAAVSGWELVAVPRIDPPHGGEGVMSHFADQFTKLSIWGFDQLGIDSLVYLDADTLVVRNFDELFTLPFTFGAVPDVNAYGDHRAFSMNFNAGMLFVRPNTNRMRDMIAKVDQARFNPWEAEQAFLNVFYGPHTARLPYIYNGNLAIKQRQPEMWESMQEELRIIHYTLIKPFWRKVAYDDIGMDKIHHDASLQAHEWSGKFAAEVMLWDRTWAETEKKFKEDLLQCNRKSTLVREPHRSTA